MEMIYHSEYQRFSCFAFSSINLFEMYFLPCGTHRHLLAHWIGFDTKLNPPTGIAASAKLFSVKHPMSLIQDFEYKLLHCNETLANASLHERTQRRTFTVMVASKKKRKTMPALPATIQHVASNVEAD